MTFTITLNPQMVTWALLLVPVVVVALYAVTVYRAAVK